MNALYKNYDFLIVDDDLFFRDRLVQALTDRGYSVLGVDSVNSAKEFLNFHTTKRILLDLKMSEHDGLELLSALKTTTLENQDMQIVILTGYGSIATATKAIKLGAHHYLTKPVSIEEILSAFGEKRDSTPINVPSLSDVEWEHIQRVLTDCEGNITQAAKTLKMHRRTLQRKLQRPSGVLK
jgi:two-component system, response regulator RegA